MILERVTELISSKFGPAIIVKTNDNTSPVSIEIRAEHLVEVCVELHQNEAMYFDMLSCITAIDNGAEANTMELAYNLYSIPYNIQLMVYVRLDREKPLVSSISAIWKTADWHEREAYDLFGIHFENHPDLRRILLPADWEGYPLRKDYEHQEYYRGIKVEY